MARGQARLDRRRQARRRRRPPPKPPLTRGRDGSRARAREPRPPKPPPAVHGGVRRRARGRGQARPAGDRDHRRDGRRDRADRSSSRSCPEQYYDVGIAEQDAVLFAAGLAIQGAKPVCAIYSTFLQRAYDQIVHDVCLQKLNVVFAMDRAGLVGDDGPTHHGAFDISYFRSLPNVVVMAPRDEAMLCPHAAHRARPRRRPDRLRYPRGAAEGVPLPDRAREIPIGTGELLQEGERVALLGYGYGVSVALDAAALLAEHGLDRDRRRRPLRQAARRRAGRAARRRARAAW